MSVTYTLYNCSNCDYEFEGHHLWGRYNYEVGGQICSIIRRIAWCHQCENLRNVEIIPNIEFIQKCKYGIEIIELKINRASEKLQEKRGLIKKILNIPVKDTEEIKSLKWSLTSSRMGLEEAYKAYTLLECRENKKGKCLECGSHDFVLLPSFKVSSNYIKDGNKFTKIDFKHPECGGQLQASIPGSRMGLPLLTRTYDLNGNMQKETDDQLI